MSQLGFRTTKSENILFISLTRCDLMKTHNTVYVEFKEYHTSVNHL